MSIRTLYDARIDVAVLYDSITGRPLPMEVFIGESDTGLTADEVAEQFLEFENVDPRGLSPAQLTFRLGRFYASREPVRQRCTRL